FSHNVPDTQQSNEATNQDDYHHNPTGALRGLKGRLRSGGIAGGIAEGIAGRGRGVDESSGVPSGSLVWPHLVSDPPELVGRQCPFRKIDGKNPFGKLLVNANLAQGRNQAEKFFSIRIITVLHFIRKKNAGFDLPKRNDVGLQPSRFSTVLERYMV